MIIRKFFILIVSFLLTQTSFGQPKTAIIQEQKRIIKTYPFSDPDPTPILGSNQKIYPYHQFEGYSHAAIDQEWKVIKLENDFIEVYVLPEVGGKVWGAIEKSTGKEFIYRNEVLKFRNISMRGPWTSGGIEFNFGIIGHHPSTATPVDYDLKTYENGDVSCIVGNIDLPSRTQWRVEVLLSPDKAFFETRVLWYNPTTLDQSYYNWMTAAAVAKEDLEFYCPGDLYLGHPGDPHSWPVNSEGRRINKYAENNFGGPKSYHVVGVYDDFFGGYYHDDKIGFGHWSPYEEIPGQKLWLWALSREGGIWEDLLTDTDGQYIEFQAGRLFNQFSPSTHQNPITQAVFEPGGADIWRELWFPVKDIGGLTEVSPYGVLHLTREGNQLSLGVNALQTVKSSLEITYDGKTIHQEYLQLKPMDVATRSITLPGDQPVQVALSEMDLFFNSSDNKEIERPLDVEESMFPNLSNQHSVDQIYRQGWEALKFRDYEEAGLHWEACIDKDPHHLDARIGLAELSYRKGQFSNAKDSIQLALSLDTYHPKANFLAGSIYWAMGDLVNALEAYGWAARSLKYRSIAYSQMATIYLKSKDAELAQKYAQQAIDFNRYNLNAYYVLAILAREQNLQAKSNRLISKILEIDPLNHFARYEQYQNRNMDKDFQSFKSSHRSELEYQTYLELALIYYRVGRLTEALKVLSHAPDHPLIIMWQAYLQKKDNSTILSELLSKVEDMSPSLVFPYRLESLQMLDWVCKQSDHWKVKYYQALNFWGKGQATKALDLMNELGDKPDYGPFYLTRAILTKHRGDGDIEKDIIRAHKLSPDEWRTWKALINYHHLNQNYQQVISYARKALELFPDNYALGMDLAQALVLSKKYSESIRILTDLKVLPFEGAYTGRVIWERAHLGKSLEHLAKQEFASALETLNAAKRWPENLGVGKPYHPDNRLINYLMVYALEKQGNQEQKVSELKEHLISYTQKNPEGDLLKHLPGLVLMQNAEAEEFLASLNLESNGKDKIKLQWTRALLDQDWNQIAIMEVSDPDFFADPTVELLQKVIRFRN